MNRLSGREQGKEARPDLRPPLTRDFRFLPLRRSRGRLSQNVRTGGEPGADAVGSRFAPSSRAEDEQNIVVESTGFIRRRAPMLIC